MKTILVSTETIKNFLKNKSIHEIYKKANKLVESSFRLFKEGDIQLINRDGFYTNEDSGDIMELMPAYWTSKNLILTKIVGYSSINHTLGLPSVIATVVLTDSRTGLPLAFIEGTTATDIRTGAASGVATKYLAREDSEILGFIGTGSQAYSQLFAILNVKRDIKEVVAFDINPKNAMRFKENLEDILDIPIKIVNTAKEVAGVSDILTTATNNKRSDPPVVRYSWLKRGVHINAIGADDKIKGELDRTIIRNAKMVPDYFEQARYAGECQGLLGTEIHAELGDIIVGEKPGRENNYEITVFDSTGTAFEDIVIFNWIYEKTKKLDIDKIDFSPRFTLDPLRWLYGTR